MVDLSLGGFFLLKFINAKVRNEEYVMITYLFAVVGVTLIAMVKTRGLLELLFLDCNLP
jgi:hypothetical protein